jgi:hypothetical protein
MTVSRDSDRSFKTDCNFRNIYEISLLGCRYASQKFQLSYWVRYCTVLPFVDDEWAFCLSSQYTSLISCHKTFTRSELCFDQACDVSAVSTSPCVDFILNKSWCFKLFHLYHVR